MKNIFFYGNCQPYEITNVLGNSFSPSEWILKKIKCFETNITKPEFNEILSKSDIIITQPISDNYRECDYMSTSYILKFLKLNNPLCQIIMFPTCYFNFYYYDLKNIKFDNPDKIHAEFHCNGLYETFKSGKTIDSYIENFVYNSNLKTLDELIQTAEVSLNILESKEIKSYDYIPMNSNIKIVTVSKFIRDNYRKKLLFYSENHPTKYLLQYIAERILDLLDMPNNIDYNADPLVYPKWFVYDCVQQVVEFDVREVEPLIVGKKTVKEIAELYFDYYGKSNVV